MRVQPVGWIEEKSKLEDMTSAGNSSHLIGAESWQVKMRMINRDTVLPRQSLLFLNNTTLHGLRHHVYVLIKILKFCTGSSAKSYQCKFGIDHVLKNRVVAAEELGKAIQDVIHYQTLRGKFSSVHPELRQEGIVRVDVGKEGFHFIRDTGDSRDGLDSPVGREDEEEMLLRQAIALSLEEAEENDNGEEVDHSEEDAEEDGEEEELMLRQAIALPLEEYQGES